MGILKNKRGEELVYPIVIFVILNIVFFSLLITFSYKSSTGALVHEEVYAKEISLLMESMEPGVEVKVLFNEAYEVAKGNERTKGLVRIEDNTVKVMLANSGGYSKNYFSSYDFKIKEDFSKDDKYVIISIEGEQDE